MKVNKKGVREYIQLLSALYLIKRYNPDFYQGHFKLLCVSLIDASNACGHCFNNYQPRQS